MVIGMVPQYLTVHSVKAAGAWGQEIHCPPPNILCRESPPGITQGVPLQRITGEKVGEEQEWTELVS